MFKLSKDGYLPRAIYEEEFNDLASDVRVLFASVLRDEKYRPELLDSWCKPIFFSVRGDYQMTMIDTEHDYEWYKARKDKILVITVIKAPSSLEDMREKEIFTKGEINEVLRKTPTPKRLNNFVDRLFSAYSADMDLCDVGETAEKFFAEIAEESYLKFLDKWGERERAKLRDGYIESELRAALREYGISITPGAVPA